jgi:hypothetical protein
MTALLTAAFTVAAVGCSDPTGGCLCRPVTGIVVSGSVVSPDNRNVATIVHLTFREFFPAARDSVDACTGAVVRDNVVFTSSSRFNIPLIVGFPVFQGCLTLSATPDATSGLQSAVVSFPGVQLRDTSAHDTLHAAIPVHP